MAKKGKEVTVENVAAEALEADVVDIKVPDAVGKKFLEKNAREREDLAKLDQEALEQVQAEILAALAEHKTTLAGPEEAALEGMGQEELQKLIEKVQGYPLYISCEAFDFNEGLPDYIKADIQKMYESHKDVFMSIVAIVEGDPDVKVVEARAEQAKGYIHELLGVAPNIVTTASLPLGIIQSYYRGVEQARAAQEAQEASKKVDKKKPKSIKQVQAKRLETALKLMK